MQPVLRFLVQVVHEGCRPSHWKEIAGQRKDQVPRLSLQRRTRIFLKDSGNGGQLRLPRS